MADVPVPPPDQPSVPLHIDGTEYETRLTRKFRERRPWRPIDRSRITTEIPGLVVRVLVRPGERLRRGDGVVVLEAMKMRNEVQSPWEGKVARVAVTEGQTVAKGALLVELV
ncbi:MAG TPA: acetyl-CoA carboxylase biotin carboxyl carrier protein subunit [Candidatus Krumholzibacteria bacterium]|nr:acetyl-CoA carboxylase biotin carboxyl carrier protein subunit [Candidatus Krumholzibacteria bacterium]HPD70857.1 acetyl-CoA carboxylase biotin carboxyl carrier protein subunit [Candidatus Krumholzibacteria bacterium]HRY39443.1 acetyl-CoA carboxylase biotin carboxyl carrier protein subunit [Candidatus Krumholzibacteria bacterium]